MTSATAHEIGPTPPPINIPVTSLAVAPENPRSDQSVDTKLVEDLADNIAAIGMFNPLIGYMDDATNLVCIVSGGRRTRALQLLQADGRILETAEVPVIILDQTKAHTAGIVDQLTNIHMSQTDEIRLFLHPEYERQSDNALAKLFGRSPSYISRRREILKLPAEVQSELFAGNISPDQAMGLCLFLDHEPELMAQFCEALDNSNYDASDMRYSLSRDHTEWDRSPFHDIVSKDDYLAAGGRFQTSLFDPDEFVLDPLILKRLGLAAVPDAIKARFPDAAFIRPIADSDQLERVDKHPGVRNASDEDLAFYHEHKWSVYRMDEGEDKNAIQDRLTDIQPRLYYNYPPELSAHLGIVWQYNLYASEGYRIQQHVLPDDLEPLYEAGFLNRPALAEPSDDAPAIPDSGLSEPLKQRIRSIKYHAVRQLLMAKPKEVLTMYAQQLSDPSLKYFTLQSDSSTFVTEEECVTFTQAYEKGTNREYTPDTINGVSAILAYHLLQNYNGSDVERYMSAKALYAHWTPDAVFLNRYKKQHLLLIVGEEHAALPKKKIVEMALEMISKTPDLLLPGFS